MDSLVGSLTAGPELGGLQPVVEFSNGFSGGELTLRPEGPPSWSLSDRQVEREERVFLTEEMV